MKSPQCRHCWSQGEMQTLEQSLWSSGHCVARPPRIVVVLIIILMIILIMILIITLIIILILILIFGHQGIAQLGHLVLSS